MNTIENDASPEQEEASKFAKELSNESNDKVSETINESYRNSQESSGNSSRVDLRSRLITDDEPPVAEALASINGVSVVVRGNYTTITGPKKARKTLLAALILSRIAGKILIFDTEQSKHHVWLLRNRILRLKTDLTDRTDVMVFHLRGLSYDEKLRFISAALAENPDVNAVMIDNVRDLIADINDPKASHQIIEFLEAISVNHNVGMLVTIHQNKSNGKIRGHLGSELENKSFMVIQTAKISSNLSAVSCESSRDGDFESFNLRHQEGTGLPEIVVNGNQVQPHELTDERKIEIWNSILSETNLSRHDLIALVKVRFAVNGRPIGEARAIREIEHALIENWIERTEPARSPNQRYRLIV